MKRLMAGIVLGVVIGIAARANATPQPSIEAQLDIDGNCAVNFPGDTLMHAKITLGVLPMPAWLPTCPEWYTTWTPTPEPTATDTPPPLGKKYCPGKSCQPKPTATPTLAVTPTTAPAHNPPYPCVDDPALDADEQNFVALLNAYRAQNGLPPLAVDVNLSRSGQWKSDDLAINNYYAHDDLDRTWVQRIRDCGFTANVWLGEVIDGSRGDPGAAEVLNEWRNSPDHNAILLDAGAKWIGCGRGYYAGAPYNWYWTCDLAR